MSTVTKLRSVSPGNGPDARTLYQTEFKFVWRAVQRLGAADGDVEDRVHDVFAIAVKRWDTFDASRSLKLWLYGIAYRVMLDFHRKLGNHEEPVDRITSPAEAGDPEESAVRAQGLSLARQIINSIEFDRRTVLVMHDLEEIPVPEIAEALEIPVNTAYSRLRLARREFNEKVTRLGRGRTS